MQIKHVFKHGTCILDTKGRIISLSVEQMILVCCHFLLNKGIINNKQRELSSFFVLRTGVITI